MERWERPPSRRGRNNPSFSSSLLDAIYRSIDESDGGGGGPTRNHRKSGAPDLSFSFSSSAAAARKKQSADELKWTAAAVSERALIRRGSVACRHGPVTPTSSSSDSSSYGGFSSSDAESYYSTGVKPVRSDRIRSDPVILPEKKKAGSIRSRLRDLRKGRATGPTSPGARLASFLNSLFAATGSPKKSKIAAPQPPPPKAESACSSASSYSRSCLSKTPSSRGRRTPAAAVEGGKRSVRFCPVSVIVGEDCRPCGHKCLDDDDLAPPPPPVVVARRVEELLQGLEKEEEEDAMSDTSSDLFELENLTAIGRYRDELPVYETTDLGTNRAIAQGLVV
ncbi:protein BIG GRAIN 1 [Cocos nucifera]|uniref:Protein BIG GRAIN 1 n=1 Tax=Cocos nucifera TaxID=13894 RepID=A0A8K0MYR2_COCNU|nr:protein BIG GRAIN 1 [Cocos nucifera]